MRRGMNILKLSAVVGLLVSLGASAICPQDSKYSVVKDGKSACYGIVQATTKGVKDSIEGDLVEITADAAGKLTARRIGPKPYDFAVLDSGVLVSFVRGAQIEIEYFATGSTAESFKSCNAALPVRAIKNNTITLEFIDGVGAKMKSDASSKVIYADCKDSGDQIVFTDLTPEDRKVLEEFGFSNTMSNELTDPVVNATLPEVFGRDEIVDTLIARLKSGTTRSTLLWGDAGTGKTTITYRLATRIVRGEVPDWMRDWSVYLINIATIGSEGQSGLAHSKMEKLVRAASGKKVVLIMDEIHQLIGMGTAKGQANDVTEVMKTNLANGQLAIIGTLTQEANELALFSTKEALNTRFTRIQVEEPPKQVMDIILAHHAKKALKNDNVDFSKEVLDYILKMTKQYASHQSNPRVSLNVLQNILREKVGKASKAKVYQVTKDDVQQEIANSYNIAFLKKDAATGRTAVQRVLDFKKDLRSMYVGQDSAVDSVFNELKLRALGFADEKRPSVFLFLGPSGVGKSYLATLVGNMFQMTPKMYPMSTFINDGSANALFGAPPQYVGYHPAGGPLVRWVRDNPTTTLIFDEADKAHPDVLNTLLNVMEEGVVKSMGGDAEAKISNGFMIFTTNYGMDLIDAYDTHVLKIPNSNSADTIKKVGGVNEIPTTEQGLKDKILNELIKDQSFGTYFAGRVDSENIVIFHHLSPDEAKSIAEIEIKSAKKTMLKSREDMSDIVVDDKLIKYVGEQGVDFRFGARDLRSKAKDYVKTPIVNKILEMEVAGTLPAKFSMHLTIDTKNTKKYEDDEIVVTVKAEK